MIIGSLLVVLPRKKLASFVFTTVSGCNLTEAVTALNNFFVIVDE